MYSVNSIDSIPMSLGIEIGFVIPSPLACARSTEACEEAFGEKIEIDGKEYTIAGFGFYMPATRIYVGENILIRVKGC